MPDPIRVGLIHCDTHGMYYGPQMEKHDPMRLSLPVPIDKPARDSWMRGGNHYYFYTHYCDPERMMVPSVEGFKLARLWDPDREVAEAAASVFCDPPRVCGSLDEVSDEVDLVFISDCNGDGSDHLERATPGLTKGVATFVDKPFAHRIEDVAAMLDLSAKHKAPVMSLSIIQLVPGIGHFVRRLPELGEVQFGIVQGGGTARAGLIHSTCMALAVFGPGVRTVRAMTSPNHTSVHYDYGGQPDRPRHGVMINCDPGDAWHCSLHVSARGSAARDPIHSPGIGDFEFPYGSAEILRRVRKMVQTGRPQEPSGQMIEAVAVADAADAAIASGDSVEVADVSSLIASQV